MRVSVNIRIRVRAMVEWGEVGELGWDRVRVRVMVMARVRVGYCVVGWR